ncbi:uncharacterized protein K452DRAFT_361704 [Aplosporella prunicola CBS 121167]|uniref:Uncharacterized protein n=1 Tax=Aplosporella prunicola CBS 121167 TaxID=1176127 RepID=A0A6A6B130_9PEZI|nr:uncharacterized protein K452DRAFT_361704 [Aplosporella prunicola CBS 121167]KAF2137740.1 hypothetical protein K452DRAFT_361704 [Aplosporella prunicola CBS 121167]
MHSSTLLLAAAIFSVQALGATVFKLESAGSGYCKISAAACGCSEVWKANGDCETMSSKWTHDFCGGTLTASEADDQHIRFDITMSEPDCKVADVIEKKSGAEVNY